jgi:hypothetical protein
MYPPPWKTRLTGFSYVLVGQCFRTPCLMQHCPVICYFLWLWSVSHTIPWSLEQYSPAYKEELSQRIGRATNRSRRLLTRLLPFKRAFGGLMRCPGSGMLELQVKRPFGISTAEELPHVNTKNSLIWSWDSIEKAGDPSILR